MPGDSNDATREDRFHHSNRRRIVSRQWLRDPNGEVLPRPPPVGTRTPNGLIWGHSCEDLMWIQRVPKVNVLTIWSRSMIKEFDENYDESEFAAPEPRPRVRRPWPVLRIAKDSLNKTVPPLGAYDDGSDHEDDDMSAVRRWRVRTDDPKTGEDVKDKIINRFVIEDLAVALMPNDGENPVISPLNRPYAALWKPEYRKGYNTAEKGGALSPFALIRKHGSESRRGELADSTGLMAVIIDDVQTCKCSDPSLLVMEGDSVKSVRHDPSPVVFVNKVPENMQVNTANVAETSAVTETSAVAGTTAEVETSRVAATAPVEETAPMEETVPVKETAPEEEPVEETASVKETAPVAATSAAAETSAGGSSSQEEPIADTNMKTENDEEQSGATRPCGDPMDVDAEPGTSVEGANKPNNETRRSSADKGNARLLMIGVPGEEDEEDEAGECATMDEGQDEAEEEEVNPEAYLNDDGTFDKQMMANWPKLEEFIPDEYFPDALIVHRQDQGPRKYKRIFPKFERDGVEGGPERVGSLFLNGPVLGEGHHSSVRRAPLKLPPPLSAYGKGRMVTVAAKKAFATISARKFLRHEAGIFNLFPRHLQEEYCGYNMVTPIKHPVPVGAVVPKFYGYYVAIEKDGTVRDRTYSDCDENDMSQAPGTSPLLLMEECGKPVVPRKFSIDDRSECYSLVCRLQLADFLQGSMYVRNILSQPGPLWKAPKDRSRDTPSFRIIDFGRALHWDDYVLKEKNEEKRERKAKDWQDQAAHDRTRVERELLIEYWDY